MPQRPECVGVAEIENAELAVGEAAWDVALREAAHAALCAWADHPNRRFYAPTTVNWSTAQSEDLERDVLTIRVRYNLEPMMGRIIAEQERIKKDLERHRQARDVRGSVPLEPETFVRIEGA